MGSQWVLNFPNTTHGDKGCYKRTVCWSLCLKANLSAKLSNSTSPISTWPISAVKSLVLHIELSNKHIWHFSNNNIDAIRRRNGFIAEIGHNESCHLLTVFIVQIERVVYQWWGVMIMVLLQYILWLPVVFTLAVILYTPFVNCYKIMRIFVMPQTHHNFLSTRWTCLSAPWGTHTQLKIDALHSGISLLFCASEELQFFLLKCQLFQRAYFG